MNVMRPRVWTLLFVGVSSVLVAASQLPQDYARDSGPPFFSYDELVQLGSAKDLSPELADKLHVVTTTPFVNNEAYYRGAKPHPLDVATLGPTLRVAFWNIERGLELDDIKLLLTDKERFVAKVAAERKHAQESGKRVRTVDLQKIPEEIEVLKASDVWILNEVDWGVERTAYRDVVRELGEALNMNWAYGVEFLEVDSKQLGTDTFDYGEDEPARQELLEEFKVDRSRLRAMHGNAVLSRYPIRSAKLIPFTVGYDWFRESKIRPLEKGKRKAAVLVGEDLLREVRRGQRSMLLIDLDVPEVPDHAVTVVSTHLENRTKPKIRRQQMVEVLNEIRDIHHPVVVGGDFNTTGGDSTPTSVENMLYKKFGSIDFWTTKGVQWSTGAGLVYTGARTLAKLSGIQYRIDPTKANIPGASANLERALFTTVEQFRFADGHAFDFRGVPERTINGRSGTLGDSNERGKAGFDPTFVAELIWGQVAVAKFKLDWIFVKSDLTTARDLKGPYRFAPHFARTMGDLNNCLPEPISDHSPMTTDLPFNEPPVPLRKGTH
jgi:endonuclease/exonuclease/phosphatase family metal-dependent hydrolase